MVQDFAGEGGNIHEKDGCGRCCVSPLVGITAPPSKLLWGIVWENYDESVSPLVGITAPPSEGSGIGNYGTGSSGGRRQYPREGWMRSIRCFTSRGYDRPSPLGSGQTDWEGLGKTG